VKKKGVEWLAVGTKFLNPVILDRGIVQLANAKGEINLEEKIPGANEPSNYIPVDIPITQKNAVINEMYKSFEFDEGAKERIKNIINKYSTFDDISQSSYIQRHIDNTDRESNRIKKDDWLQTVLPFAALILTAFVVYFMLDMAGKQSAVIIRESSAPVVMYCTEAIKSCGGVLPNVTQTTPPPVPLKIT
jgi:hypothetical protein